LAEKVSERLLRVARQFIAGIFAQAEPRPVGTDEMELGRRRLKKMIERPAGTRSALFPKPGNKLPGYSQPSRRDG